MNLRLHSILLLVTVLGTVTGFAMPGFSTAVFTSATSNGATVSAAVDWTPPTVSLQAPGTPVKDTVNLTATAADAETGIKQVSIQYLSAGGAWVTVCTRATAPYTCAWNTRSVSDGSYDLRATATDNAGYSAMSAVVRTTVANNLLVVLGDPGDVVRGTVLLPVTLYNAGTTSYTVRVEYAPSGTTAWKTVCNNLSAPFNCSWNTNGYANDYFDLRAVAVAGGTTTVSTIVTEVLVDNQAPTVTMTDPGSPLTGTRTFAANAADAHSGVAQVVIQYAPSGSTSFQTLCTITADPYTCRYDTTRLPDGTYSFRAIATDLAGNVTTSAALNNRAVDNTVSSVSLEDPGAFLAGQVTLVAEANSSAGIGSVVIQYSPSGSTTWSNVCAVATGPYTCTWDTVRLPDGLYDLRAVLVDGSGRTTISMVVSARRVDNTPLRGADVQTANGSSTIGRAENGDRITFTYTDQVELGSITPGWTGDPLAVSLRLRDGGLVGLTGKNDTLDVLRPGSPVHLGSVNLKEDYVKGGKTAVFNATMTAGIVTLNGAKVTHVTVTLGALASGSVRTAGNPSTMIWTPSGAVTDLFGNASSAVPTAETGVVDREF